jgi:hypothetical protein
MNSGDFLRNVGQTLRLRDEVISGLPLLLLQRTFEWVWQLRYLKDLFVILDLIWSETSILHPAIRSRSDLV